MSRMSGMTASIVHDFGIIADGNEEAVEVTVPGAQLGDFAFASVAVDIADGDLSAAVTAANTVTCVLGNDTGGNLNLASTTLRVKVVPFDVI